MPQPALLINCDLGEGIPEESLILPWIDVASVACGGHFGDRETIHSTLSLAKKYGKKVGAHPSYPDRANFGRRTMTMAPLDLINSIKEQILLFLEEAKELQLSADHIKFHGALYNDAASNPDLALVLIEFLKSEFSTIPLFVPPNSVIEQLAIDHGLPIRREVFGDRSYEKDYRLSSRTFENALFTKPEQVTPHMRGIVEEGILRARTGEELPVKAETLCFHGDNPGILDFLPLVRKKFWK
jgi:5-oxoprolinase (ATP-hydrolysing) subunit A